MNIRWDARNYSENFSFVPGYGQSLIDMIDAEKGSTVLDLGCGNGILTNALREKGYAAAGLDSSDEFLAAARENYPQTEFISADAVNFKLATPVDVVFSNAVFHWIDRDRQADMLRCVYNCLKKGGQFVFEFGGRGNNELIHGALAEVFREHGSDYRNPFYFPSVGEYAALVEKAGFAVRYAALFERPTELKGENGLKDWINTFIKSPFAVFGSADERQAVTDEAVAKLKPQLYKNDKWYADYVRLRMKAVKP